MRNLKVFETSQEKEAWTKKYDYVSYIVDIDEVCLEAKRTYLTIIPRQEGKLCVTSFDYGSGYLANDHVYYSIDNGATWNELACGDGFYEGTEVVSANTRILLKGNVNSVGLSNDGGSVYIRFKAIQYVCGSADYTRGQYDVEGCVTSLVFGDSFDGQDTLSGASFAKLFQSEYVIDASKLILPSDTTTGCYNNMFNGCSQLIAAPELKASVCSNSCYREMFSGCTHLDNITMLATDVSATDCLLNWTANVAASGTLVKKSSTTLPSGASGIPQDWTVKDV